MKRPYGRACTARAKLENSTHTHALRIFHYFKTIIFLFSFHISIFTTSTAARTTSAAAATCRVSSRSSIMHWLTGSVPGFVVFVVVVVLLLLQSISSSSSSCCITAGINNNSISKYLNIFLCAIGMPLLQRHHHHHHQQLIPLRTDHLNYVLWWWLQRIFFYDAL